MSVRDRTSRLRHWLLQTFFELLYRRLGFLHETAGRVVYGAAWDGRRRHVVSQGGSGALLDLGCGEGRLLSSPRVRNEFAVGVEPSPMMTRRARRRKVLVIQATALALPLRDGSVMHVVATYPGPWILDHATWDEIARVSVHGGTVKVLLGGDIVRGRGAFWRRRLLRLAYGDTPSTERLPALGNDRVHGEYVKLEDEWGTALLWSGMKANSTS